MHFIPAPGDIAEAEEFFKTLAPDADEILSEIDDTVQFRDCGGNLEFIRCPICATELSTEWWQNAMDAASDADFAPAPLDLLCGHAVASLNDLHYYFDQGFSRFELSAMNPNLGLLSPEHLARFEQILRCPLKVIYQHI